MPHGSWDRLRLPTTLYWIKQVKTMDGWIHEAGTMQTCFMIMSLNKRRRTTKGGFLGSSGAATWTSLLRCCDKSLNFMVLFFFICLREAKWTPEIYAAILRHTHIRSTVSLWRLYYVFIFTWEESIKDSPLKHLLVIIYQENIPFTVVLMCRQQVTDFKNISLGIMLMIFI